MTISRMALGLLTGASGLGVAVVGVTTPPETVPFLQATIWTVKINGQDVAITGQGCVAIVGAIVGVGGLFVSIVKLLRNK